MNALKMAAEDAVPQDRVSRTLIWVLLLTTVCCWAAMIAATVATPIGRRRHSRGRWWIAAGRP